LPTSRPIARLADGSVLPFQVAFAWKQVALRRQGEAEVVRGRSRWVAGGAAIAYIDIDERERTGVFVQDFVPGRDTTSTRRPVGGFADDSRTESFAVSPDGRRLTLAVKETSLYLMIAEGLPGPSR
jgi:hypothetical protein